MIHAVGNDQSTVSGEREPFRKMEASLSGVAIFHSSRSIQIPFTILDRNDTSNGSHRAGCQVDIADQVIAGVAYI